MYCYYRINKDQHICEEEKIWFLFSRDTHYAHYKEKKTSPSICYR